jgi:hypothetical protein
MMVAWQRVQHLRPRGGRIGAEATGEKPADIACGIYWREFSSCPVVYRAERETGAVDSTVD